MLMCSATIEPSGAALAKLFKYLWEKVLFRGVFERVSELLAARNDVNESSYSQSNSLLQLNGHRNRPLISTTPTRLPLPLATRRLRVLLILIVIIHCSS